MTEGRRTSVFNHYGCHSDFRLLAGLIRADLEGIVMIHSAIEKDRVKHTGNLLEKIKGVIEVEILQAHVSNLIKEP
jgi:hypothetical protein